jgi:hypothetical protein
MLYIARDPLPEFPRVTPLRQVKGDRRPDHNHDCGQHTDRHSQPLVNGDPMRCHQEVWARNNSTQVVNSIACTRTIVENGPPPVVPWEPK